VFFSLFRFERIFKEKKIIMISLFLCPFIYFISLCTASIGSASGIPSAGMPTEFNHVCTFKDVAKLLILGTISCFSLSFDVREFSKRENLNLINVPREFLCFLRFCVLLFILLVLEQLLLEMILEPLPLAAVKRRHLLILTIKYAFRERGMHPFFEYPPNETRVKDILDRLKNLHP